jgi:hypothetical protein
MQSETKFEDKAGDVADFLGVSKSAVYRLAREGRLPCGTFVYLNERTLRLCLPAIKRAAAEGAFSKPLPKDSAVANKSEAAAA